MGSTAALIPMQEGTLENMNPGTSGLFVALDLDLGEGEIVRFVGQLAQVYRSLRDDTGFRFALELTEDRGRIIVRHRTIVKGWWAPMGYRPVITIVART